MLAAGLLGTELTRLQAASARTPGSRTAAVGRNCRIQEGELHRKGANRRHSPGACDLARIHSISMQLQSRKRLGWGWGGFEGEAWALRHLRGNLSKSGIRNILSESDFGAKVFGKGKFMAGLKTVGTFVPSMGNWMGKGPGWQEA